MCEMIQTRLFSDDEIKEIDNFKTDCKICGSPIGSFQMFTRDTLGGCYHSSCLLESFDS